MIPHWRPARLGAWFGAKGIPFLQAVWCRFNADRGSVLAGYLAYSAMLSLLPFLVFATALAGFMVGPENSRTALDTLFAGVPAHVAQTLEPVVLEVLAHRRSGILTLSALGSIWAASNGIEALRVGFDGAYDVEKTRHLALNRLYAVLLVLGGFAVFAVLAFLIILAPLVFHLFELATGLAIPEKADVIRYALGISILWISLWILHRVLPSRPMGRVTLWPGILTSVVLWGLIATGLSVYLAYAPSYSITYGALAGVILTLLFFYLTGIAIILGAQVNAVVNANHLAATSATDAPEAQNAQIRDQA
ncbi:MAG: YihY/virulence factor BrkB family protein [Pikeienuella sp.]